MKPNLLSILAVTGALAVGVLVSPSPSHGQAGSALDDPAVTAILTELAGQQATIAENQTKIDEKIAKITEEVRQARLFVARGGGAK